MNLVGYGWRRLSTPPAEFTVTAQREDGSYDVTMVQDGELHYISMGRGAVERAIRTLGGKRVAPSPE